ncbi:MAG TPA: gamma-glutamylcyclotransferase [Devosiaceae bacterium]|jgi:cation transport protein ChaC|nr:gamma-glutamylcyclotransferase [Devosiaceae bacterium]
MDESGLHWVFGYGSLIWRPGFDFVRRERALLRGAHRSLSIYSYHYRGTAEVPGLVFGLARGGSCSGLAFAVEDGIWPATLAYLRERELVTSVYRETVRPVRLADGTVVPALAYLLDERHEQYAGRLTVAEQARLVRRGVGVSGANVDYVLNTARHLGELGIRDRALERLVAELTAPDPDAEAVLAKSA